MFCHAMTALLGVIHIVYKLKYKKQFFSPIKILWVFTSSSSFNLSYFNLCFDISLAVSLVYQITWHHL